MKFSKRKHQLLGMAIALFLSVDLAQAGESFTCVGGAGPQSPDRIVLEWQVFGDPTRTTVSYTNAENEIFKPLEGNGGHPTKITQSTTNSSQVSEVSSPDWQLTYEAPGKNPHEEEYWLFKGKAGDTQFTNFRLRCGFWPTIGG